jgi:hypothetical protein
LEFNQALDANSMKFGFQNLKDKLLSKGDAKIDSLPLSAYGKLTLYKDYINLEVNDGPAAIFKKWMDQAFGMTFEEFGGRAVTLDYPSRIVWNLPGAKALAVGVVWPSTDEGGLRKFPFSFFTVLSRGAVASKPLAEGLAHFTSIWLSLERLYAEARDLSNIESFYSAFRERKAEPDFNFTQSDKPEPSSLPEWLAALSSSDEAYPHRLTEAVSNLIAGCRSLSQQGGALAARLPISSSYALIPQVCLWERAFRENLKNCAPFPSMILPSDATLADPSLSAAPAISIIWRDVIKEDARLFASDVTAYDNVEDIAGESRSPAADIPPISDIPQSADIPTVIELPTDFDSWLSLLGR